MKKDLIAYRKVLYWTVPLGGNEPLEALDICVSNTLQC